MAQLIGRNLEEEVVRALQEAAGRHGRSAEEEHREILRKALLVAPPEDRKTVLLEMPDVGEDEDFMRIRDLARQPLLVLE